MKIKPNYKIRDIAGEKMVVMQGDSEADLTKVIMLNTTGEWLWNSLWGKEFSSEDVSGMLVKRYGIESQQADKDASAWLDSMLKVGLIEG